VYPCDISDAIPTFQKTALGSAAKKHRCFVTKTKTSNHGNFCRNDYSNLNPAARRTKFDVFAQNAELFRKRLGPNFTWVHFLVLPKQVARFGSNCTFGRSTWLYMANLGGFAARMGDDFESLSAITTYRRTY